MKQILIILSVLLISNSCDRESKLEGFWCQAYILNNEKAEPQLETYLYEFQQDKLYRLKIRDLSTGNFGKTKIDTFEFKLTDSAICFNDNKASINIFQDSLILNFQDRDEKVILRKLDNSLKHVEIDKNDFEGSYVFSNPKYRDSIDFINDSILIYTGKFDKNFPAHKWEIIDYKGYKFFNQHKYLYPVLVVKYSSADSIELHYPFKKDLNLTMIRTNSDLSKNRFLGRWIEISNTQRKKPVPPSVNHKDLLYRLKITSDSIKVTQNRHSNSFKWNLTSDGNRIYFIDKILENEGSWKILGLSDSTLTIRLRSDRSHTEEIVKFRKNKNSR